MVPIALTWLLVALTVGLAVLVLGGMLAASTAGGGAAPVPGKAGWVAGGVVVAWVAAVFALSGLGLFAATPTTKVPLIGLGIAGPIALGWLALKDGQPLRKTLDRLPLPLLVGVQLYRVLGFVFLVAYARKLMPAEFAFPAGIGDILVGVAAIPAALALARGGRAGRQVAIAWNVAGIADLVLAVSMGFFTSPSAFQLLALHAPNAAISRYPFVLIPTFAVPVSILLHLLCLSRLRRGEG